MTEQEKAVETVEQRAEWERPEVCRLEAGSAELAGGGVADLGVLS
jgi:hypothetical protein